MLPEPPAPNELHSCQMGILLCCSVAFRYRTSFERKPNAPTIITLRLAVIPRVALEAAHWCLLSCELAAGILQAKGIPRPRWTPVEKPIICDRILE